MTVAVDNGDGTGTLSPSGGTSIIDHGDGTGWITTTNNSFVVADNGDGTGTFLVIGGVPVVPDGGVKPPVIVAGPIPSVVVSGGSAVARSDWDAPRFACKITGPDGWINLDDHERFIVEASSFAGSATTWRRNQVSSPYIGGKYTVTAVPDQVTENVAVWVLGDSQTDLMVNLAVLIDAISQPAFDLQWSADNAVYSWSCDVADYTVDFINTSLFARQLLVKLSIQRNPVIGMGSW